MKKLLLLLIIPLLSLSQDNIKQEYFKNGQLKHERTFEDGKEIIVKTYYKNGQLRYQKNNTNGNIEEYYKNGQLYYRKIDNETKKLEEIYSKDGSLTVKILNGKVLFSAYDGALNELKERTSPDTEHGHGHHHGHGHNHGHHHH